MASGNATTVFTLLLNNITGSASHTSSIIVVFQRRVELSQPCCLRQSWCAKRARTLQEQQQSCLWASPFWRKQLTKEGIVYKSTNKLCLPRTSKEKFDKFQKKERFNQSVISINYLYLLWWWYIFWPSCLYCKRTHC